MGGGGGGCGSGLIRAQGVRDVYMGVAGCLGSDVTCVHVCRWGWVEASLAGCLGSDVTCVHVWLPLYLVQRRSQGGPPPLNYSKSHKARDPNPETQKLSPKQQPNPEPQTTTESQTPNPLHLHTFQTPL